MTYNPQFPGPAPTGRAIAPQGNAGANAVPAPGAGQVPQPMAGATPPAQGSRVPQAPVPAPSAPAQSTSRYGGQGVPAPTQGDSFVAFPTDETFAVLAEYGYTPGACAPAD